MARCRKCGLCIIDGVCGCDETATSSPATGSVSFSIEEIRFYLEGLLLVGEHEANNMLNCAISLLDDLEDGIEAVLERRKQNND